VLGHTVLAALLLGEAPRPHHAVGMALIAAGIWFAARKGAVAASRVRGGRSGPTG
jgi:drug/metabolite transporter (DMT)-like permease